MRQFFFVMVFRVFPLVIASPVEPKPSQKVVRLRILSAKSGQPIAARFAVEIDGKTFIPDHLSKEGIRFTSIHTSKKQRVVALYSRGNPDGEVRFPVPDHCNLLTLHVTKGYEFLPVSFETKPGLVEIRLRRWINLAEDGWHAADTHLHYERLDPKRDSDFATMLGPIRLPRLPDCGRRIGGRRIAYRKFQPITAN